MEINEGQVYVISDKYFDDFKDDHFSMNKNGRPSLVAVRDLKRKDIYWAVPRTKGGFEKYSEKYKSELKKRGFCDKLHVYNGYVYLIQNMFPISENYISHAFTVNNNNIIIFGKNRKEIESKVKKAIAMAFNGINPGRGIAHTDIKKLYEELIYKLDSKKDM